jgi:L-amino acid N-acyltransferase YncA
VTPGAGDAVSGRYPRSVRLESNAVVSLRLMARGDADGLLAFARGLPADDLLFLRTDITSAAVVAQWADNVAEGGSVTVIAEVDGAIAGYASLHRGETGWQAHLGEIRLQAASRYRSQGLGRAMAGEMFVVARTLGLRKLIANMTADQKGAIATFERLGFRAEALLRGFVIDRGDRTRDLVVMAYDVEGLTDRLD